MKIFLVILALTFTGCASGPRYLNARNCKKLYDNVYRCEEIPEKAARDRR